VTQKFQYILGIKFFTGDLAELLESCAGQFVVVPAAPALVDLPTDAAYREAVEKSDFAITDSGFMLLLWKIFTGRSLIRISGLKFLRGLLAGGELKEPGGSFWIMPSVAEMEANLAWLNRNGFPVAGDDCFAAPLYPKGALTDAELVRRIEVKKPRYIIVNLGGGVQERLGYHLRNELSYRPAIICVGAAIAFITGLQSNIPVWADAFRLGWLIRCLRAPGKFIPRYWKAIRLVGLLARYRERSVAVQPE
jgi:UDP-N-acetyl-D-mannosaminuronic acid transferase (WecB/TagA/CpsF family)